MLFGECAALLATCAGDTIGTRASAVDHGHRRAIELGDGDHDGGLNRQQTTVRAAPLVQGLELYGVGCDIGHIQLGQNGFGGVGIVVGRATDQREAGE